MIFRIHRLVLFYVNSIHMSTFSRQESLNLNIPTNFKVKYLSNHLFMWMLSTIALKYLDIRNSNTEYDAIGLSQSLILGLL